MNIIENQEENKLLKFRPHILNDEWNRNDKDIETIESNACIFDCHEDDDFIKASILEHSFFQALLFEKSELNNLKFYRPNKDFQGQDWYEKLDRITKIEVIINDSIKIEGIYDQLVDSIKLKVTILNGNTKKEKLVTIQSPVWINGCDPSEISSIDDQQLLVSKNHKFATSCLVDFMKKTCFLLEDDKYADSYHTQKNDFLIEAQQKATRLIVSPQQAFKELIEFAVTSRVFYARPDGYKATIEITSSGTTVIVSKESSST